MLYYKDDGGIDEEVCNRVVQNIINDLCPHVKETGRAVTTLVAAVYIAAAVGTDAVATNHAKQYKKPKHFFRPRCGYYNRPRTFQSGIFRLRPYHIAIVKKSHTNRLRHTIKYSPNAQP